MTLSTKGSYLMDCYIYKSITVGRSDVKTKTSL